MSSSLYTLSYAKENIKKTIFLKKKINLKDI